MHAEIVHQSGTWWIKDLLSRNGTWVNGDKITELTALYPGDQLLLGDTEIGVDFTLLDPLPLTNVINSVSTVDELNPPASISEDERIQLLAKIYFGY